MITLEDQERLKEEILGLFGMTYVPDKNVHSIDLTALEKKTVRGERKNYSPSFLLHY